MGRPQALQRRASFQTRKGRCSTLNCRIILSLNRSDLRNYAVAASALIFGFSRMMRSKPAMMSAAPSR
ncbi:hypothetical protein GFM01_32185 [Rhizobium laguerreae]|nr:hypothetical protein [Rhizobium laguerreae]NKM31139.1 hypothetical protein [Rhizobium laguerreae]NKM42150.1 hypothetical protein [Rhizobium laguerreae]